VVHPGEKAAEAEEHAEAGRWEEACEAYDAAVAAARDDLDVLLGAAELYVSRLPRDDGETEPLERGLELARRGSKLARRAGDASAAADFAALEGIALSQLGSFEEALSSLDAALRDHPDDVEARLERGYAFHELCRLDDARRDLEEVVRRSPDEAWAHHLLGLVAERRGDAKEAERRFARARKLDPEGFPRPVSLTPADFDSAVEDALAELPEQVRRYLSNVAIAVEDLPADDDLLGSSPPLSPSILGVFRGSPLGQKASPDPWSHFPSSIVLYQRNLERFARDEDELIHEIGVTLVHEVGHFLGLDEDDLWELGLD
jgi:predicted Zn-dependent protease with MMP-like domain/Flp pilus assembly protein TadD